MENDEMSCSDLELLSDKKPAKITAPKKYKLGEEISNGILYFGNDKVEKEIRTSKCVCICGEAFRASPKQVVSGRVKHCGCKRKSEKS